MTSVSPRACRETACPAPQHVDFSPKCACADPNVDMYIPAMLCGSTTDVDVSWLSRSLTNSSFKAAKRSSWVIGVQKKMPRAAMIRKFVSSVAKRVGPVDLVGGLRRTAADCDGLRRTLMTRQWPARAMSIVSYYPI